MGIDCLVCGFVFVVGLCMVACVTTDLCAGCVCMCVCVCVLMHNMKAIYEAFCPV